MILFKFPYDFNLDTLTRLTDMLASYNARRCNTLGISSVYLPAFKEHCMSARNDEANEHLPNSWQEYAEHIHAIKSYGYTPDVLFQEPHKTIDESIIQMYLDEGVRTFTVAEDDNARTIKRLCPEAYVIASITKVLAPNEIHALEDGLYDEVCLYFWYNRNLKTISSLPKQMNYSVVINAWCSCTCESCHRHWFSKDRHTYACEERDKTDRCGISDLHYFTPYIHTFKLQGRDYIDAAFITFDLFLERLCAPSGNDEFSYGHYYELGAEFPKVRKY